MNVVCEANPAYGIFKSQRPSRSAPFEVARRAVLDEIGPLLTAGSHNRKAPIKRMVAAMLLSTAALQAQDQKKKDDYSQFQVMAGPTRAA